MTDQQLTELLIKYTQEILDYDNDHPNVGMGKMPKTAIAEACQLIRTEAARWDRVAVIRQEVINEVVDYFSKRGREKVPLSDTFAGWKSRGYCVIRGQKSTGFNQRGEATFTYKQVAKLSDSVPYERRRSQSEHYASHHQDSGSDHKEPETVYYADGSGYVNYGGPCGPLYFDRNGDT